MGRQGPKKQLTLEGPKDFVYGLSPNGNHCCSLKLNICRSWTKGSQFTRVVKFRDMFEHDLFSESHQINSLSNQTIEATRKLKTAKDNM